MPPTRATGRRLAWFMACSNKPAHLIRNQMRWLDRYR
jgi:hypothetical protein